MSNFMFRPPTLYFSTPPLILNLIVKVMRVLDFQPADSFSTRACEDAMEISYLIGIATRELNTEYRLKEVRAPK